VQNKVKNPKSLKEMKSKMMMMTVKRRITFNIGFMSHISLDDSDQFLSLSLVSSSNHKDIKITECVTLLMRDVVLHTYPMELIDTHLKNIVQTRLLSYSKSGNLEDLWEDLIFMNFMIHFKTLIKQNPNVAMNMDIVNYEYGVHLPDANMIKQLIEKSIE